MDVVRRLAVIVMILMSLAGLALISREAYNLIILPQSHEADRVYYLWRKDLALLRREKKLPAAWPKIKEVQLIGGTPRAQEWFKKISSPIDVRTDGDQRLEVLLLDWNEGPQRGFIVQYTLIDLKSGNLVSQFGRTFSLSSGSSSPTFGSSKPSAKPSAAPAESN